MSPFLQYTLVVAQAVLAGRLALAGRRLLAMYFGLSAFGALDYHPLSDSWWATHWLSLEPIRMLVRTLCTFQAVWPLPRNAILAGELLIPALILWIWPTMPSTEPDRFAARRMLWLFMLGGWLIFSGLLAVLVGYPVKREFWLWAATMMVYAVGSANSWRLAGAKELAKQANREYSSVVLLLVVMSWSWIELRKSWQKNLKGFKNTV